MSWRKFFHRSQWDAERVQEIQSHIAQEIDDNTARGLSPEEARRQAYLKFGNPQQVREEIWRMNSIAPLENLPRDLRYAWRTLLRNPGYQTKINALIRQLMVREVNKRGAAYWEVLLGCAVKPVMYTTPGYLIRTKQDTDPPEMSFQPSPLGKMK